MKPQPGFFCTDLLAPRSFTDPDPPRRLYLALLPDGRFVRTLGPAEGFDFPAYATRALGGPGGGAGPDCWPHFHHLGKYRAEGLCLTFTASMILDGEVYAQRWSAGCVAPEILLARGEVYRRYEVASMHGGNALGE